MSNKRATTVGFLTAGIAASILATTVGPAAAQGTPVGGSGNLFFLSGAGSVGGEAQKVIAFGEPGDEVFYGDWDGDGVDSPMVRRSITFLVSDANGALQSAFAYGNPGDTVVIGDWDGDGKDSIAVQRGNHFLVKNDNKKSGTADSEFYYGDKGDVVLAGDWDGNGTDTLAVQRQNRFFVKNDTKTGTADFDFYFGDAGDAILVGDWANPADGTSGNGADQLAVQRSNHFFLSADLGADGKGGSTTLRDFYYGDAGDQVFVASLPTHTGQVDEIRTETYAADVAATHKAGEPILKWAGTSGVWTQDADAVSGKGKTYSGGEAVVQVAGAPQVFRGGEPIIAADGKPYVVVANDATDLSVHEIKIGDLEDADLGFESTSSKTGTVAKYMDGDVVLNSDGTYKFVEDPARKGKWAIQVWSDSTSNLAFNEKALPDDNTVDLKVGDTLTYRAGEQLQHNVGDAAVYETAGKYVAATSQVIAHNAGDLKLDSAGKPVSDGQGGYQRYGATEVWYKTASGAETKDINKAAMHQVGDAVTHVAGELVKGYQWTTATDEVILTAADAAVTTAGGVTTVTSTSAPFVANDLGRGIESSDGNTDLGYVTKVVSATTVEVSESPTVSSKIQLKLLAQTAGWVGDNNGPAALPVLNDEAANVYTTAFNAITGAVLAKPTAATAVSKLDDNTDSNPAYYRGGEAVKYGALDNLAVSPTQGGEAVLAHHAGEVKVDENGKPITTGTGKELVITGDGLGVRRNIG